MDDCEIVARDLARDESAIRETAGKYGARLRSLALGIVRDAQTAEECENDTYLEAWNSIPPHEPGGYLYPFLARITPQGLAALQPSADEVKDVFFVPLDYLQNYPEEVYRYKVAAQVDDRFPYERMGFPKTYPWRTGFMDVPIYEYQGHFIWGMTARTVRWLLRQLQLMEEGTP